MNNVPEPLHYLNKLTDEAYDSILETYGNGCKSVVEVVVEGYFACLDVRFNNGEARYFLRYYDPDDDQEESFFFELDLPTFYGLVSAFSSATSLQRLIDESDYLPDESEPYPEQLFEEFDARCMFVIGKCKDCGFLNYCGGYKEGYLNVCPWHWCDDEEFDCMECEHESRCSEEREAAAIARIPSDADLAEVRAIMEAPDYYENLATTCWKIDEAVSKGLMLISADTIQREPIPEIAALKSARLVTAIEGEKDQMLTENQIKKPDRLRYTDS